MEGKLIQLGKDTIFNYITGLLTGKFEEFKQDKSDEKFLNDFKELNWSHKIDDGVKDRIAKLFKNTTLARDMYNMAKNDLDKSHAENEECIKRRVEEFFNSENEKNTLLKNGVADVLKLQYYYMFYTLNELSKRDIVSINQTLKPIFYKIEELHKEIIKGNTAILKELCELKEMLSHKEIYTLSQIDKKIKVSTCNPSINIDFFTIDDEEFKTNFKRDLQKNNIYIYGRSKEETTYCILNELRFLGKEDSVFVIKDIDTWNEIAKSENFKRKILIPFFYADEITSISNNTNIFVGNDSDKVQSKSCLNLRRRTKKTIVKKLENAGLLYEEAHKLVDSTNGLYLPMKKKIYNGQLLKKPKWVKEKTKAAIVAMLCEKWTECEGDKAVVEKLFSDKYDEFYKCISRYSRDEEPLVLNVKSYRGEYKRLADFENVWELMSQDLDQQIIDDFFEIVIKTVTQINNNCSDILKTGMLRSLIMLSCFCNEKNQIKHKIDSAVNEILETAVNIDSWAYISKYIQLLSEISPDVIISRLENELTNPTGLIDLFEKSSKVGTKYIDILFSVEQLLFQKKYVHRAVEWLWEINERSIEYPMANAPNNILSLIFCPWVNLVSLSKNDKISLSHNSIIKYGKAWEIIYNSIPANSGAMATNISKPILREVDDVPEFSKEDFNEICREYFNECRGLCAQDVDRWSELIKKLDIWDKEIIHDTLKLMIEELNEIDDSKSILIKNQLRELIYEHSYFRDAHWAMDEECIELYLEAFNKIHMEDDTYDYIYLFHSKYSFPILNPDPYNKNESSQQVNEKKAEIEIGQKIKEFESKNLDVFKLISLCSKENMSNAGIVLGKYYQNGMFDENFLKELIEKNADDNLIYNYLIQHIRNDNDLLDILVDILDKKYNKYGLAAKLLRCKKIEYDKMALINSASCKVQEFFWNSGEVAYCLNKDRDTVMHGLEKCLHYSNYCAYIEILYIYKSELEIEEVYEKLVDVVNKLVRVNKKEKFSSLGYQLNGLLQRLFLEYSEDKEKSKELYNVEMLFSSLLGWEKMLFTQQELKGNPYVYAEWLNYLYKKDTEYDEVLEADDFEKRKSIAKKLFHINYYAKFCPAEKDGEVEYDDLVNWCNEFKVALVKQKQERLFSSVVGRLFANSPLGEDNNMPHESVRKLIEEIYNDKLKNAYVIEIQNSRGMHLFSQGKSERELSLKYKNNADDIRLKFPRSATIYDALAENYRIEADRERECAENEE